MSAHIVIVVPANVDPTSPGAVTFFAVDARSPQEAEDFVIKQLIGDPLFIIDSRAVPESWPTQPGQVVYI